MIHRISASLAIITLLTACGGGGSAPSTTILPKTPANVPASATFSFKIPGKSTMARIRRPYYVSQATLGVAIDWVSTTPTHPDYSAAVTAACPGSPAAGIIACTVDAQGNTDYTFQLQIPAGTYPAFTVSTFDAAPSGGAFTGNMLAQGQLGAPVVITAGQANVIPALTFYGVPAAVSFGPATAQTHTLGYNGGYGVIGNAPQTFYAQALDADGFAISSSDSGAPTVSISESATDVPQYFAAAATANKYAFTLKALTAATNLTTAATINVSAAPPAASGLAGVQQAFLVTSIPELWVSQNNGSTGGSIYGYPMTGAGFATNSIEPIDDITTTFLNSVIAVDNNGNLWASNGAGTIQEFSAGVGSAAPTMIPANTITKDLTGGSLQQVTGLAVDANNVLWAADEQAPGAGGNGEVVAYNISNPETPTALSALTGTAQASLTNPVALAVAPTSGTLSTLGGTVWVASVTGRLDVLTPTNGATTVTDTFDSVPVPSGVSVGAIAIATNGTVWLYDVKASAVHAFATTPSLTLTPEGSSSTAVGAQGAVDPADTLWTSSNGGGFYRFTLTGCPGSCAATFVYLLSPPNESTGKGVYIAP